MDGAEVKSRDVHRPRCLRLVLGLTLAALAAAPALRLLVAAAEAVVAATLAGLPTGIPPGSVHGWW